MKTKTENILMVLKVLAWIAMIGFAIEAGSKIISLVISFYNPEAAKNLYKGMDLFEFRQKSFGLYIQAMTLSIALAFLKVKVWYLVIKLLSDLNLQNPFNIKVSKLLEKTAYSLLSIGIIGLIASGYNDWVEKYLDINIRQSAALTEYLFIAGIVYIISQIFKRGVELQEETELTV